MREVWKSHAGCGTLVYQAFSCIPNDRKLNLLSNGAVESFWDALWLGIGPFLCSTLESHRIFANIFLSVETPFV